MFRFRSIDYCMLHRLNMPQFLVCITLALQFSTLFYAQVPELVVPIGHTRSIRSVDFSSDNRYILSCSDDNTIKLWDAKLLKELRTISIHKEGVRKVAFLPGDSTAFSAGLDGVYMFSVTSGEILKQINWNYGVFFCDINRDGNHVLFERYTDIVLFSLKENQIIDSIPTAGRVESMALHPDKESILLGMRNGMTVLYSYPGKEMRVLADSGEWKVTSVAYSFNGQYIAAGYENGKVIVWNEATGEKVYEYALHNNSVKRIRINENPLNIISAGNDRKIYFIDVKPNTYITIANDYDWMSDLATVPGFTSFVYGESVRAMRLFSEGTWKTLSGMGGGQRSVNYHEGSRRLFSTDNEGIMMWDFGGGVQRIPRSGISTKADVSSDGKYIAVGTYSGRVYQYMAENPDSMHIYYGAAEPIEEIGYTPDGTLLTAVAKDSVLRQWHRDSTWPHVDYYFDRGSFRAFAFTKDAKRLAAGTDNGLIEFWKFDSTSVSEVIKAHRGTIADVIFSADDRIMASTGVDGNIHIYESRNGKYITTLANAGNYLRNLAFRKDNRKIYAGDLDKTIYETDINTGEVVRYEGHDYWIEDVTLLKGDSILASASLDGTIILWDVYSKNQLVKIIPLDSADWVAVMPDGRFDGSQNGIALMYYVRGTEVIPLEAYFNLYYTPGLIHGIIAGNIKPFESGNSIKTLLPAPVVSLEKKGKGRTSAGENTFTVEAADGGGGIRKINIYMNGKLVHSLPVEKKEYSVTGKYKKDIVIELLADTNYIKAVAENEEGLESYPAETIVFAEGTRPVANLYILGIGINTYKNEKYNLSGAVNDIRKISSLLQEKGKGVFAGIYTTMLNDKNATKKEIIKQLQGIKKKIKASDVFVLLYSGHGVVQGGENGKDDFYFVLHDIINMYGGGTDFLKKALSSAELKEQLSAIKANKQLVVIDACQAGGALESFALRGAEEEKAISTLARSSGVFLLASSSKDQFAKEVDELGMGLYSYSLYEAIDCLGDFNEDGIIQVREIEQYTRRRLAELTKQYKLTPQYPVSWMILQDFPVAVCK